MSGSRKGPWFPMQANFFMDEAIRSLTPSGQLAYIRSLCVSKTVDRDGFVAFNQCDEVWRNLRRVNDLRDAIVERNLWTLVPDGSGFGIRSWQKHNPTTAAADEAKAQATARQQKSRSRRAASKPVDVSRVTLLEREEKREEVDRPPSGSGRSTSASAAPRSAGGAAHPPQLPTRPEVVSAVDDARRRIADAKSAWRAKLNKPPIVGNGRDAHVDFSATLAKLTEAAERLAAE